MENLIQNIFYFLLSYNKPILQLLYNDKKYFIIVKSDVDFVVSQYDIKYHNKLYIVSLEDLSHRAVFIDEILDILQGLQYQSKDLVHDINLVISNSDFNEIRKYIDAQIK